MVGSQYSTSRSIASTNETVGSVGGIRLHS
jgi:hypothetical protein